MKLEDDGIELRVQESPPARGRGLKRKNPQLRATEHGRPPRGGVD